MSAIKFLDNAHFDDDVEIQFGDTTTPDGKIYGNSSGLFVETATGKVLSLACAPSSGLMVFGYGGTNYFFFMTPKILRFSP